MKRIFSFGIFVFLVGGGSDLASRAQEESPKPGVSKAPAVSAPQAQKTRPRFLTLTPNR
jgi:hypothetical protein